jgi:proteasome lid subunit RPN8/RPN11
MNIPNTILEQVFSHAYKDSPRECCGVICVFKGRLKYVPCTNIATDIQNFIIDPEELCQIEDSGEEIVCIVHSHVNIAATPSQADLVSIEYNSIPWLIVSIPSNTHEIIYPTGYRPPRFGREYTFGVLDCYSLIRDIYLEDLNIPLRDMPRWPNWWEDGVNLYVNNAETLGFQRVTDGSLKPYDIILMQTAAPVPDHGAVLLPCGHIAQHMTGRLSSKDVYGGYYRKVTTHVYRYPTLC